MPLTRCSACRELVSDAAVACPKCGEPNAATERARVRGMVLMGIAVALAMCVALGVF